MLINNDRFYIGFDLSYEYAQISYCRQQDETPLTYSLTEGSEQYNIPVSLFKRKGINQWFVGREAEVFAKEEDGIMLRELYSLTLEREIILIEDEEFETIALLALFIKRALCMPGKYYRSEKIAGIAFTVPTLNEKSISMLQRLSVLLNLKDAAVFFSSREESIYQYVIRQPGELFKSQVVIFDGNERGLTSYRLIKNTHTTPMVILSEEKYYGEMNQTDEEKDSFFLEVIESMQIEPFTCVFLIGEQFKGDWCQESLRELCSNKRVFKGNNLYSKGACYCVKNRMDEKKSDKSKFIFLGKDKLKTNVGMQVKRGVSDSYLAILDGGENWYECKKEFDVILPKGNCLQLLVTPLDGRNGQNVEIVLEGLAERPTNMTRLRILVTMSDEKTLNLDILDLGFGDFYPTTGMKFSQQIHL